MAVIPRDEAEAVLDCLVNAGYSATFTESTGGRLHQSQKTIFIAVEEEQLKEVISIVRSNCRPDVMLDSIESRNEQTDYLSVSGGMGNAVVFIWNLDDISL